jgi:hypothetical protein
MSGKNSNHLPVALRGRKRGGGESIVTFMIHLGSVIEQQPHRGETAVVGGMHQRSPIEPSIHNGVYMHAAVQQFRDLLRSALRRGLDQCIFGRGGHR